MVSVRSSLGASTMGGQDDWGERGAQRLVVVDRHGPSKTNRDHDGQPGVECDGHDRSQSPLSMPHVSEDMRLIRSIAEPQGYHPVSSFTKIHAHEEQEMMGMEESSQEPSIPKQLRVPLSQQPSPEYLASLGIKVRDFAYENTLPPIIPVPRIPRQVQPEPLPRKCNVRGWDDESSQQGESSSRSAKPNSQRLERKATEPLDKESLDYAQALEQVSFRTMHALIRPVIRTFVRSATPPEGLPVSPLTSPLSPSFSQEASQESELVQTPSPMKLVADDASILSASQTPMPDALSCDLSPQPLPPSFLPTSSTQSQPPAPGLAFSVPDLFVESQPTSTPRKRRCTRRVGNTPSKASSPGRYQLRRRPSTRRPQPYPVTSTAVSKKNSLTGVRSHRARQRS